MTCDKIWIFEVNDFPNKIKQCRACHEKGWPARLILEMAVHPYELKGTKKEDWPKFEWEL